MIVLETPQPTGGGRFQMRARLASTLVGKPGTEELVGHARRIGLRPEWLRDRGTPTEHFLLFDAAIDRARAAGATDVTRDRFDTDVRDAKWRALNASLVGTR